MAGPSKVLIVGSAPDAVRCVSWPPGSFDAIVAINNAWRVRPDWDYLVHADDFPKERRPSAYLRPGSTVVPSDSFVPAQNAFGGFVYAGGTMAFTAAYWALHALKPDVLAFIGCDMVYPRTGPTHFYGRGTPDPLREDVTLRSLEAKSSRLFAKALSAGTVCLNLSDLPESRLAIPRATLSFLDRLTEPRLRALALALEAAVDRDAVKHADVLEDRLGYFVEDGRYWERLAEFDPAPLAIIDDWWLASCAELPSSVLPGQGCWSRVGARRVA